MTTRPTTIFPPRAALCLALGAALLASSLPARAEDNDMSFDTKIIDGFMRGIGLKRDGDSGIAYGDRAPLVIPPSRTLPPPENSSAALAKNPAWPDDPDVRRAKQQIVEDRNRPNADDQLLLEQSPMRQDQLTPGVKKPRYTRRADDGYRAPANGYDSQLSPKELGSHKSLLDGMFAKDEPDTTSFTKEPPRAALTEPPPGYQTPSPGQPYGVGKKQVVAPTSSDYLMDHPVSSQ